eukprot:TRINITY_DN24396_c0_g1_i1.p1 TRINITY_DN24396_c0_g1~~TRINITY_DN24396_c0_g1_i1.p1  ORF type:complete len:385 (+),score=55.25 TRINITY_DN24396_c0_g1_i1:48-1157(+)
MGLKLSLKTLMMKTKRGSQEPVEGFVHMSEDEGWELIDYREKKTLGAYVSLGVLGRGATSTVHVGREKKTNALRALKVMPKWSLLKNMQSVENERDIMASLQNKDNKFILRLWEAFHTPYNAVFILEYMKGNDLHALITTHLPSGHLTEQLARYYTIQLTLGLQHIHSHGIVYRDLKPENCLLDLNGNLKIADFGLSCFVPEDGRCHAMVGTLHYMAPEILQQNDDGYSYPIDWWALGVTLYNMATGCNPYQGRNPKELLDEMFDRPVDYPVSPSLSESCKDLITCLLNVSPAKRMTGHFVLTHPWVKKSGPGVAEISKGAASPPFSQAFLPESVQRSISIPFQDQYRARAISSEEEELFSNFDYTHRE